MNLRFKKRRSLYALAASALLVACSHDAVTTLPAHAPLTPSTFAPSTAQARAQGVFPLRAAAAARHAGRTTSTVATGHCAGSVTTQNFGTLTYAVRGTKVVSKTIDATGCDVGIFIGTGDGENDNGAHIAHVTVSNAGFGGILVTDGADAVDIDNATVDGVGANAGGPSAGLAIDGATHVHVTSTTIVHYPAYGFLAEAGASFSAEHVTATGPGAVTSGAQAGFLVAGATQLGNDHPISTENLGTGATPAFLVPANGSTAQSYGFYYCAVVGKDGQPLTAVGNAVVASDDSTATYLAATCPGLAPTATPTPAPTPTPPGRLYIANMIAKTVEVFDAQTHAHITTVTDPSMYDTQDVALAGNRLYATVPMSNAVDVFDTTNNAYTFLRSISGNGMNFPDGLAASNGKLYVANAQGNTISVFDIANNYAPLPAISDPGLNMPRGLLFVGSKLYVTNASYAANSVQIFDTANGNALAGTITDPTLTIPTYLTYGEGKLYVATGDNGVDEFDTQNNNALVQTIGGEPIQGPLGLTFANGTLFVSNAYSNTVNTFQVDNNFLFATWTDPSLNGAFGMAVQ